MYAFLIVIHVIVCLVLIAVILLQAGRGGGLSDAIGGGQPNSIFGTQTNVFMTRATEVCAVVFIVTSLSLGILSAQKGKSLVERDRFAEAIRQAMPAAASTAPVEVPAVPQAPTAPITAAPAVSATTASQPAENAKQ